MKNYLLSIGAFLLIPFYFAVQSSISNPEPKAERKIIYHCPDVYDPVCGSDGKTYSNGCYATVAGVTYTKGACGSSMEF